MNYRLTYIVSSQVAPAIAVRTCLSRGLLALYIIRYIAVLILHFPVPCQINIFRVELYINNTIPNINMLLEYYETSYITSGWFMVFKMYNAVFNMCHLSWNILNIHSHENDMNEVSLLSYLSWQWSYHKPSYLILRPAPDSRQVYYWNSPVSAVEV